MTAGRLGSIRFARTQYLSRVTDWYGGWDWVRTRESGRSHLLAAGCHAVDALRWCSGLEPLAVSAFHTHFTDGYEWPTSIVANLQLEGGALGHVTSSTDFMMPYVFSVELMGDRATLRQDLIQWLDQPITVDELTAANPVDGVRFEAATDGSGRPAIRIRTAMPDSADVSHHPFQDEIDELVESILDPRKPTTIDVFDAQKTMEICLAADRSAELGGAAGQVAADRRLREDSPHYDDHNLPARIHPPDSREWTDVGRPGWCAGADHHQLRSASAAG